MKWFYLGRYAALLLPVTVAACASTDRPTEPSAGPTFLISDAVHGGGTPGFYFLPPMVAQPSVSGSFDADIAALNPAIAICDITGGPDSNCGDPSGTVPAVVFTITSVPAITLNPSTPQYQVNWDTKGTSFIAGHTYRLHVTATDECGHRKELGFSDVLLTTTPGQVKQLASGETIVLQDGRTLPIHTRIETGALGDCWTTAAPMPTPRYVLSVTALNGFLYAIGGHDGSLLATLEAYNPVSNVWTTRAPMPTPRFSPGSAAVNGILYVVGGYDGSNDLSVVEAYDPASDSWVTKAPMPTPRHALGVAVINGILYAVGGRIANCGCSEALNVVEAYDPATDTWTTKTSMPTARYGMAVAPIDGILYVVGGWNENARGTVEAYMPQTDTWTTKTPMPTVRQGLGMAAINGILYAVGGIGDGIPYVGTLEAYDPLADTWTTRKSMPSPRNYLGVAATNGAFYAVGGNNGGVLGTVEVYHP